MLPDFCINPHRQFQVSDIGLFLTAHFCLCGPQASCVQYSDWEFNCNRLFCYKCYSFPGLTAKFKFKQTDAHKINVTKPKSKNSILKPFLFLFTKKQKFHLKAFPFSNRTLRRPPGCHTPGLCTHFVDWCQAEKLKHNMRARLTWSLFHSDAFSTWGLCSRTWWARCLWPLCPGGRGESGSSRRAPMPVVWWSQPTTPTSSFHFASTKETPRKIQNKMRKSRAGLFWCDLFILKYGFWTKHGCRLTLQFALQVFSLSVVKAGTVSKS